MAQLKITSEAWRKDKRIRELGDGVTDGAYVAVDAAGWDEARRASLGSFQGSTIPAGGLASGSVERTVTAKLSDTVSVKDFGAIGDGATDDTAAISAAITALSGTKTRLLFPPGTYNISGELPTLTSMSLVGEGGYKGNAPLIQQTHATAPIIATATSFFSGCAITDLRLWGQTTSTSLVTLNGADTVKRCYFSGSAGSALALSSSSIACVIEDILIINVVYARSGSTQIGGLTVLGTDHWIERIESNAQSGYSAVSTNKVAVAILIGGANHWVANVVGELSDVGIVVTADKSRFTACRSDLNMGDGWNVSGAQNLFIGAYSLQNGTATDNTYDGIICSGVLNVWVAPMVASQGSDTLRYGIRDTVNSASQKNIWLSPRVTQAVGTAKYNITASAPASLDFGRTLVHVPANQATIDVAEVTVIGLSLYTSPTTITNFTNGTPGQEISILGDADVTIANNANIITKSGANIVCTATSAHKFITHTGASWREI